MCVHICGVCMCIGACETEDHVQELLPPSTMWVLEIYLCPPGSAAGTFTLSHLVGLAFERTSR